MSTTKFNPGAEWWCEKHKVKRSADKKHALLYKCTHADGYSSRSKNAIRYGSPSQNKMLSPYVPGAKLTAPDFDNKPACGHGLHLSPTTGAAANHHYHNADRKFLACKVKVNDIIPLSGSGRLAKCKVRTLKVLQEVPLQSGVQLNKDTATGDQLIARRGGHTVDVIRDTRDTVTIRTLNGKESTMMRKSISKTYVSLENQNVVGFS